MSHEDTIQRDRVLIESTEEADGNYLIYGPRGATPLLDVNWLNFHGECQFSVGAGAGMELSAGYQNSDITLVPVNVTEQMNSDGPVRASGVKVYLPDEIHIPERR